VNLYETMPGLMAAMSYPRRAVGALGEMAAAKLLEMRGYRVSFTGAAEKRGDLRVVSPVTGEVVRVEVKTARRCKDGKWRFTLKKKQHTDYRHSDVVVLLAVIGGGAVVPFVIPVADLGERSQVCITSSPAKYAGRWARYRQSVRGGISLGDEASPRLTAGAVWQAVGRFVPAAMCEAARV